MLLGVLGDILLHVIRVPESNSALARFSLWPAEYGTTAGQTPAAA
jgi:hypothetical protein